LLSLALVGASSLGAQQSSRTEPVAGLRANGTGFHALVGARVVTAPGQVLDNATIVVRNGVITAVGAGAPAPAGARVWDLKGLTVYPGFIDAHADLGGDAPQQGGDVGPTHWNPQVRAWFSTTANAKDDSTRRQALRPSQVRRQQAPAGARQQESPQRAQSQKPRPPLQSRPLRAHHQRPPRVLGPLAPVRRVRCH
jgi:hypothetical protein